MIGAENDKAGLVLNCHEVPNLLCSILWGTRRPRPLGGDVIGHWLLFSTLARSGGCGPSAGSGYPARRRFSGRWRRQEKRPRWRCHPRRDRGPDRGFAQRAMRQLDTKRRVPAQKKPQRFGFFHRGKEPFRHLPAGPAAPPRPGRPLRQQSSCYGPLRRARPAGRLRSAASRATKEKVPSARNGRAGAPRACLMGIYILPCVWLADRLAPPAAKAAGGRCNWPLVIVFVTGAFLRLRRVRRPRPTSQAWFMHLI